MYWHEDFFVNCSYIVNQLTQNHILYIKYKGNNLENVMQFIVFFLVEVKMCKHRMK